MIKMSVEYMVECDVPGCNGDGQGLESLDAYRDRGWFVSANEQIAICPHCMGMGLNKNTTDREKIFAELENWVAAFDATGADMNAVQALALANFVIETFRKPGRENNDQ